MNTNQITSNPYAANPVNQDMVPQESKNNTLAIAALILGILSFFFYFITAIPGIILGHMARSKSKRFPVKYTGKGMALAGLIMSYLMLFVSLAATIGLVYLFKNNPEFKEAFMQGMNQGLNNQ